MLLSAQFQLMQLYMDFKKRYIIQYKSYTGKEELNPKKHTITKEMIISLTNMLLSDSKEEVEIGLVILKRSNINENYQIIFNNLIKSRIWMVTPIKCIIRYI